MFRIRKKAPGFMNGWINRTRPMVLVVLGIGLALEPLN